jgi:hypothetical protein
MRDDRRPDSGGVWQWGWRLGVPERRRLRPGVREHDVDRPPGRRRSAASPGLRRSVHAGAAHGALRRRPRVQIPGGYVDSGRGDVCLGEGGAHRPDIPSAS